MIDDKIQELIDSPDKMREALHIAELDAMIHSIYPCIAFAMDYRVEVGKRAQRPFFIADFHFDGKEWSKYRLKGEER